MSIRISWCRRGRCLYSGIGAARAVAACGVCRPVLGEGGGVSCLGLGDGMGWGRGKGGRDAPLLRLEEGGWEMGDGGWWMSEAETDAKTGG